jgi:hypothetical protein
LGFRNAALAVWALVLGTPEVAEAATLGQLRAKVRTEAAKSYRCPRRDVVAEEIRGSFRRVGPTDGWDFLVAACGEQVIFAATDFFGLRTFSDRGVRDRAPDDLDCDADEIEVTWVDVNARSARGCGRVARYRYTGHLLEEGSWVIVPDPRAP